MFGSSFNGANAYAQVGMETGVVAASPHRLIVMLFDGAIIALQTATRQMQESNIPAKGKSISKAIAIIDGGLRASLDKNAGGEIADNLDSLYEYMSKQLLMANLKNDPAILEEVLKLLVDLKGAWCAIDDQAETFEEPAVPVNRNAYDPLAPNISTLVKA
jgi:flagellar secretion chaperone FliS